MYSLIRKLDAQTVIASVLTSLEIARKGGNDEFTTAITLQIYNELVESMSSEVIGKHMIPTIMPHLMDPTVEKQHFSAYKDMLMKMLNKI